MCDNIMTLAWSVKALALQAWPGTHSSRRECIAKSCSLNSRHTSTFMHVCACASTHTHTNKKKFSSFMCIVFYLHVCTCMLGIHRSQKRTPDSPELELQAFVSHHVGSGNWTWALWRRGQCSELLSYLPSPNNNFLKREMSWWNPLFCTVSIC